MPMSESERKVRYIHTQEGRREKRYQAVQKIYTHTGGGKKGEGRREKEGGRREKEGGRQGEVKREGDSDRALVRITMRRSRSRR